MENIQEEILSDGNIKKGFISSLSVDFVYFFNAL